jgi:hypothetical protein
MTHKTRRCVVARKTVDESGAELAQANAGPTGVADPAAIFDAAVALIEDIPEAPDGDGLGIIGALLDADDWEDLNRDAHLPNGKDVAGQRLRVSSLARRLSDLGADDGTGGVRLPHYLVIDSVNIDTGEVVRWQTSAPALVVPLAKLHRWGRLPAIVQVNRADKPTKAGFYPLNLHVHAVG